MYRFEDMLDQTIVDLLDDVPRPLGRLYLAVDARIHPHFVTWRTVKHRLQQLAIDGFVFFDHDANVWRVNG